MPIPDIRAVTFDFYNTLVFPRAGRGRGAMLIEYLREHGLQSDPWDHQILYDVFARHHVEYDPLQSTDVRREYYVRFTDRVFRCLNVRAPPESVPDHATNVWQLLGPSSFSLFAEVRDVLELLSNSGYALAVVSNWQCGLHHFCTELQIGAHFEHVLSSAEVGLEKPDPRIFGEACRRLSVQADQVLHVGDSVANDIDGGRNAGLHVVLLQREAAIAQSDAATIRSLTGVAELLGLLI